MKLKLIISLILSWLSVQALAQSGDSVYDYTEASDLNLIGKIIDTDNPYHRVDTCTYKGFTPAEANQVISSAGLAVLFTTNSSVITVKPEFGYVNRSENTMGISLRGFDLYIRDDEGKWLYAGSASAGWGRVGEDYILVRNMTEGVKECMLYLPIYSELRSLKIGVEKGAEISAMDSPFRCRIGVYGSSYTHGISTARPGMSYPMQFMRHTGLQVLNLGCNGNCKMQPYFTDVLCDADVDAFLFDTFSNPSPEMIRERLFPFIERIQKAHPGVPLIFMQTIYRGGRNFDTAADSFEQAKMDMAEKMMSEAVKKYPDVYFIVPDLGEYGVDSSVDGIHPSDMGYLGWARSIEKPVLKILKKYDLGK